MQATDEEYDFDVRQMEWVIFFPWLTNTVAVDVPWSNAINTFRDQQL